MGTIESTQPNANTGAATTTATAVASNGNSTDKPRESRSLGQAAAAAGLGLKDALGNIFDLNNKRKSNANKKQHYRYSTEDISARTGWEPYFSLHHDSGFVLKGESDESGKINKNSSTNSSSSSSEEIKKIDDEERYLRMKEIMIQSLLKLATEQSNNIAEASNLGDNASVEEISPEKQIILKRLQQIRENPNNSQCADCSNASSSWASLTFGVLLCYSCVGAHRSLGASISFTQSLSIDISSWTNDALTKMEKAGGNIKVNEIYEYHVPFPEYAKPHGSNSTGEHRRKYIRAKYVDRKFCKDNLPEGTPPLSPITERRLIASQSVKQGKLVFCGMLEISITKGRNLKGREMGCSPYVAIELGGRMARTHFIKFTRNPTWDASPDTNIELRMTWDGFSPLRITVWDRDKFLPDYFIGRALLDVSEVPSNVPVSAWIKIYDDKQKGILERAFKKLLGFPFSKQEQGTLSLTSNNEKKDEKGTTNKTLTFNEDGDDAASDDEDITKTQSSEKVGAGNKDSTVAATGGATVTATATGNRRSSLNSSSTQHEEDDEGDGQESVLTKQSIETQQEEKDEGKTRPFSLSTSAANETKGGKMTIKTAGEIYISIKFLDLR